MSEDLKKLAKKLGTEGPHKALKTPRLIQLLFSGVYIVKTTKAVFVWEHPYYPQLYLPSSEFISPKTAHSSLKISEGEKIKSDEGNVVATQWTLSAGDRSISEVIAFANDLKNDNPLAGLVKVSFDAIDQWFEESTPIFVHPKDPFKRVDIISSTRPLRVSVGGKVVAETCTSAHLYETGLPVRYYIPLTAIDPSVLRPSKTTTKCPYKGTAEYYSVEVDGKLHEDVVWYYTTPLLESAKIEGLCCFYNEKVEIELDGEKLESPETIFSKNKPSENKKPSAL